MIKAFQRAVEIIGISLKINEDMTVTEVVFEVGYVELAHSTLSLWSRAEGAILAIKCKKLKG